VKKKPSPKLSKEAMKVTAPLRGIIEYLDRLPPDTPIHLTPFKVKL
jgi:hypothetical protein